MEEEFNNLAINNTPITFTGSVDNVATSDELLASPIYQDKLGGTSYSRSKAVSKAINFAGISLLLTAAAIKTGSLISNAYILNPPSIVEPSYVYKDHTFTYNFTVSNKGEYEITYFLYVNEEEVIKKDCSKEQEYTGSCDNLKDGDKCHFYIEFTNGADYKKTISNYEFIAEE